MSDPPLSDRLCSKPRLKIMVGLLFVITNTQKSQMSDTLEGLRGFMRDCMEDSVERGVLYGTGAYKKGEVRNLPVFKEAYEAGKSC